MPRGAAPFACLVHRSLGGAPQASRRKLRRMPIPEHLANRDIDPSAVVEASGLPDRARVVIVGGGIIGSSIAYHLTRDGRDRRRAARAREALERHDLARGGARFAGAGDARAHGALSHQRRDVRTAPDRDRDRDRPAARRGAHGRPHRGAYAGDPVRRRDGEGRPDRVEVLEAAAVKDLWPCRGRRRSGRCRPVSHRRHGEPGRRHDGLREGRRRPRGAVRAGDRRPRVPLRGTADGWWDSTPPGARSTRKQSCSRAVCGRANWRARQAPASPSTRPSTCG